MKDEETFFDENEELVTLTFDDGTEEVFELIAELDYEGKWYAYLVPQEPSEDFDDDEVLIYEIGEDEDGNEVFLPVDDDALLDKLADMLNKELEEVED